MKNYKKNKIKYLDLKSQIGDGSKSKKKVKSNDGVVKGDEPTSILR